MLKKHIHNFICPVCKSELIWDVKESTDKRIIHADIICSSCKAEYHVKDEIAVFLTPDLQRTDLWKESNSLAEKLKTKSPELLYKLMNADEKKLTSGDLFLKALIYENSYDFIHFQRAKDSYSKSLYSLEQTAASESQFSLLAEKINTEYSPNDTIVDIACGRGYLSEYLFKNTQNEIMMTDFSPTILKRNKFFYKHLGFYHRLTLVAFDGRRTPFKDNSVSLMVSNVGIQNIDNCENIFKELERILSGKFYSIMSFFPETDSVNLAEAKKYNVNNSTRSEMVQTLSTSNIKHTFVNSKSAYTGPIPFSKILNSKIDALPAEPTTLEITTAVIEG